MREIKKEKEGGWGEVRGGGEEWEKYNKEEKWKRQKRH